MNELYFKVLAKCGHVGKNFYIEKWFYVRADNGKDAAKVVRNKPRVKHNHKDAIRQVIQIEYDEYINGIKIMKSDMYFKAQNIQEQKLYNCIKEDEVYPEEKPVKRKKDKSVKTRQRLKHELIDREMKKIVRGKSYGE